LWKVICSQQTSFNVSRKKVEKVKKSKVIINKKHCVRQSQAAALTCLAQAWQRHTAGEAAKDFILTVLVTILFIIGSKNISGIIHYYI
jgi:hypothetical protein